MFAENLWVGPILPLASFLLIWPLGKYFKNRGAELGLLTVGAELALSLGALMEVKAGAKVHHSFEWIPGTPIEVGYLVDPVSALMMVIVCTVAFLVHLFSIGYMEHESGKRRYFSMLSLFTASMTGLAISSTVFLFFIFFELVGLCSYFLIGFHWEGLSAPRGAVRAFMVTKFGDLFFMAGLAAIFVTYQTYDFKEMAHVAHDIPAGDATLVALLLLGGAMGKSAQFPLHTWLGSDRRLGHRGAMEGPTPVSALIHAATMVAAGVYLVIRGYPIFSASETALTVIAYIGGFTALYAAIQGVVAREIKSVLAFSTVSQYGYMMLGLGVGGYSAAMFHLMNHAFFKALLFLGAGSIIVATHHENDIFKMGGLAKRMPITAVTFAVGGLALMGVFPFSGYFSKDLILEEAYMTGNVLPFLMGFLGAAFTAFYTTRMIAVAFFGEPSTDHAEHATENTWVMTIPLIVLGLLAATSGFSEHALFEEFITFEAAHAAEHHMPHIPLPMITSGLVLASAALSLGFYWDRLGLSFLDPVSVKEKTGPVYDAVYNGFYQDHLQLRMVDATRYTTAGGLYELDSVVVDGLVNFLPENFIKRPSFFLRWSDDNVVDGIVDWINVETFRLGDWSSRLQTGFVQNYIGLFALGIVVLAVVAGLTGRWLM